MTMPVLQEYAELVARPRVFQRHHMKPSVCPVSVPLPQNTHMRNFSGVLTGEKNTVLKRHFGVFLLYSRLPPLSCGAVLYPISEMERTPTPQNLNAGLAHYKYTVMHRQVSVVRKLRVAAVHQSFFFP